MERRYAKDSAAALETPLDAKRLGGLGLKKFTETFKRFLVRTDGFEMIEYGVMTAIIVGAVVITLVLMMVVVSNSFAQVAALL